jgi:hypothetical protein
MDQDYLSLLEKLHAGQINFHYASVTRQGEIVGLLYFQVIRFQGSYLKNFFRTDENTGIFMRLIIGMLGILLDFLSWNLLVAGNIFFTGERGIYFSDTVPEEDIIDLIHQSITMVEAAESRRISAYMMNNVYDDNDRYVLDYLNNFKYAVYPVDPDMFMHFKKEWASFDDYLASLSSKYRVRTRKVLKVSEPVQSRLLDHEEMQRHEDIIHRLYTATADHVSFNLGYLDRCYFCEMKQLWGDEFQFIGYFLEEKLVGFMSLLVINGNIDVNYMGMDYACNRELRLYNRMLIDLVRLGIDRQTRIMHLGRTATEIKSTIGADARGMKIYLYSRTSWRHAGMRFFQPYFGSPQYILRQPFKG